MNIPSTKENMKMQTPDKYVSESLILLFLIENYKKKLI